MHHFIQFFGKYFSTILRLYELLDLVLTVSSVLTVEIPKNVSFTVFLLAVAVDLVGNKANGRISKRVFQESKARQNFQKTTFLTS